MHFCWALERNATGVVKLDIFPCPSQIPQTEAMKSAVKFLLKVICCCADVYQIDDYQRQKTDIKTIEIYTALNVQLGTKAP